MGFSTKKTNNTPNVIFNPELNEWTISGRSYPTEASTCYQPILLWLKQHENQKIRNCTFKFELEFFNTNSSKVLLDILILLKERVEQGNLDLTIKWYYESDDEDIKEAGESLMQTAGLTYELISV